ncbi:c-type cytochrome [Alteromonas sp. 5E99-2]|uniref:di-heme oxidoreductase family protein n=1 Tax=Alteromonas sp. 5E99-2 TaxID=2817683 RepID=UPI001A991482|nr:di-heme oxidoredictase family protein [Alteromonas sp. 5E99-2]MBO1254269.1 c-type cytochrome [Alteromonas sp. 5E99-2]
MYKKLIVIACSSTLLFACGGGGSDDDSTATPVPTPDPVPSDPVPTDPVVDHSGLEPLDSSTPLAQEFLSGGDTSVFLANAQAFETRPDAIAADFSLDANFTSGDLLFRSSHTNIGPLLNSNSCQGCHLNDGRGVLPASNDDPFVSILMKLSDSNGNADPTYGSQLQTFAEQSFTTSDFQSGFPVFDGSVNGDALFGEAFPFIVFEEVTGTYPDGQTYSLRQPTYRVKTLSYGPFVDDIQFSPRIAPQVFGAGLLGAIPAENILSLVDESDEDNDGISGKASIVSDLFTGEDTLGRFGYKAQTTSVLQQTASAYLGDMGITTSVFPDENCTDAQIACLQRAQEETEVDDVTDFADLELAFVEFYNRVLGVPVRRGFDEANAVFDDNLVAGRELFFDANCTGCHTARHVTGEAAGSVLGELSLVGLSDGAEPIEILSNQVIYPYTDLLLHDMGGSCEVTRETLEGLACSAGEECQYVQRCDGLADGVAQGDAFGSEWKTPPLWGIGLVQTVNASSTFLHDGRARTIEEAILWHGGEAEQSKQRFMNFTADERADLLAFVESL